MSARGANSASSFGVGGLVVGGLVLVGLGGCLGQPEPIEPTRETNVVVRMPAGSGSPSARPGGAGRRAESPAASSARVEPIAAPPAVATPRRSTTPQPTADEARKWWEVEPDPAPGRVRVVARGEGPSLMAARQAAVVSGRRSIAQQLGVEPEETTFEKSQAFRRRDGSYEAYVLISSQR